MSGRRRTSRVVLAWAALAAGCTPPRAPLAPRTTPEFTSVAYTDNVNRTGRVDLRHESSVGERKVVGRLVDVWAVLPDVFAHLEIEATTIDSAAGVIGNPRYRARRIEGQRMSAFLDCGRTMGRDNADSYSVTLSVLVHILPAPDGGTVVRTVLDAYARDPSTSSTPVHCITWGSLETRIAELVAERLEA